MGQPANHRPPVGQPAPAASLQILHPCLAEPRLGVPLQRATLGDRHRLGILLEGCAFDAHLGAIGRRPNTGWAGARISAAGRLVAVAVAADESPRDTPRDRAVLLLRHLFGNDGAAGRGEARRIARELSRRWALYLMPISADALVEDVLHAAPFLWLDRFAAHRESLGAQLGVLSRSRLSVVGPAAFRRQVLRHARTLPELHALLRDAAAALLWKGEAPHEVSEPRSTSWSGRASDDRAAPRDALRGDRGAAEDCGGDSRSRDGIASDDLALDRLLTLHRAGRWRAVVKEADRLRREGEAAGVELELARLAADAHLQLRRWRGAASWAAFAIAHGGRSPSVAELLAAWVAWASPPPSPSAPSGDVERPIGGTDGAAVAALAPLDARSIEPLLLWARIEAEHDAITVIGRLSAALRRRSRGSSSERGRIWLELGRARLHAGDAHSAERAFAHAHRHLRLGDCVVDLWRAASALADARLRRGALEGLEDAVASLSDQAGASADPGREIEAAILGLRLDLARGREQRAAAVASAVLDRLPRGRRDPAVIELESLRSLAESGLAAGRADTAVSPALSPAPAAAKRIAVTAVPPGAILGGSRALIDALVRIDRLARGEVPVLLCGETGTGKELAAKRLHAGSPRRQRAFLAVNCAALSESLLLSELFGHARGAFTGADREHAGVFEAAQGGVVFLDEIGDLPIGAQGALLRVLQEGEVRRLGESRPRRVDVRVVAATHRDLAAQVESAAFRQDLYYRLSVAKVRLPPLRERGDDVLLLARQVLAEHGGGFDLAADAERLLLACPWPGNVRELRSVIQVAAAVHDRDGLLRARDLEVSPAPRQSTSYHAALDAERRRLVEEALMAADGQRAEAARRLGITPQAISYLVRRLGLRAGTGRAPRFGRGHQLSSRSP